MDVFSRHPRKILDPEKLSALSPVYEVQSIDSARLACKILQNKALPKTRAAIVSRAELCRAPCFSSFWTATLKILISKSLDGGDPGFPLQNIEGLRLTGKILPNKYLAQDAKIAATPFG